MGEHIRESVDELTPQVCFIFHSASQGDIDVIKPSEGKNASAIFTNHEHMTIVDFRSGLVYMINGDNTKIISYRNGLQPPPGMYPPGMMVPIDFGQQSPLPAEVEPFIA